MATREASFKKTFGLQLREELSVVHAREMSWKYPTMTTMRMDTREGVTMALREEFYTWLTEQVEVFSDEVKERTNNSFRVHVSVLGDEMVNVPNGEYAPLKQERWLSVHLTALELRSDKPSVSFGRDDNMMYTCALFPWRGV